MTVTRGRGPRNHAISMQDPDWRLYDWSKGGPWSCDCGASGDDQTAAEDHLRVKAKAAFGRMNDGAAFASAVVSGGSNQRDALHLLTLCRTWYGSRQIRRHMTPYYDSWGCIAARLDWAAVAAELEAGTITGEENDLLVLRIATSLAGVTVPLRLADLWKLTEEDTRHVREVLSKRLRLDGDE